MIKTLIITFFGSHPGRDGFFVCRKDGRMAKPKKLVFINGRRTLVDYDTRQNKDNNHVYNKHRQQTNSNYLDFYRSSLWRKARAQALLRDDYMCQSCGGEATMVDHIVPSKDDWQDRLNLDNLQSLCKSCHYQKTKIEYLKREKGHKRAMQINIIAGYPASGKATYVKQHQTDHDLIYNYDSLMHALTGLPYHTSNVDVYEYIAMFKSFMLRKLKREQTFNNVWLIMTLPDASLDLLLAGHKVNHIMMSTSKDVCINRLVKANRYDNNIKQVINDVDKAIDNKDFSNFKVI